jgi:hypothetical protein
VIFGRLRVRLGLEWLDGHFAVSNFSQSKLARPTFASPPFSMGPTLVTQHQEFSIVVVSGSVTN